MLSCIRELLLLSAVMGLLAASRADEPKTKAAPAESKAAPQSTDAPKAPAVRTLSDLDLPPDAIIILCEQASKALSMLPKAILLSPERYQELRRLEEEKMQKRLAEEARPNVPGSCIITGAVDGDIVKMTAQFKITTHRPRSLVTLGCQRAWVRAASIDGRLPQFAPDTGRDESLIVEVESAGTHQLTLELAAPITARSGRQGERGFDLGLPRAAITSLERLRFGFMPTDVRVNGRLQNAKPADGGATYVNDVLLGAANHIEVLWKNPGTAVGRGQELVAADGKISVHIEEKRVISDVELNLQVLRGETDTWRILLPVHANIEIREPGPLDDRIENRGLPTINEPWLTLQLKRPSAIPLRLVLQIVEQRQPTIAIGPVLVLGALRQQGTIAVNAPAEFRLTFAPGDNVSQRELPDDSGRLVAGFNYWKSTVEGDPSKVQTPFLRADVRTIPGRIESRVDHTLQLNDADLTLQSRFEMTPIRTSIDAFDVQLPQGYPWDHALGATPAELVDDAELDVRNSVLRIKLAQRQSRPFNISLTARFPVAPGAGAFRSELPRPLNVIDRGGGVTVVLPEGMELATPTTSIWPRPDVSRKNSWRFDKSPQHVEIQWKPYRPELEVKSVIDVQIDAPRAIVTHRMSLQSLDGSLSRTRLAVPASLVDSVRVISGGVLNSENMVRFDPAAQKNELVLTYSTSLAAVVQGSVDASADGRDIRDGTGVWSIPLIRAVQATKTETKVRIWCNDPLHIQSTQQSWQELPTEIVQERDTLPVLVLHTGRSELPLTVVAHRMPTTGSVMLVERALIQVAVGADSVQHYRVRYKLNRALGREISIDLGIVLVTSDIEVALNGRKTVRWSLCDEEGRSQETGNRLRCELDPDDYPKPLILELVYRTGASDRPTEAWLRRTFSVPRLLGAVFLTPIRCQIGMPAGWVVVWPNETGRPDVAWHWHGGLLTPHPRQSTADLDRWWGEPIAARLTPIPLEDCDSYVVGWQSENAPLRVLIVPQLAWLLLCSLLFLAFGFLFSVYAATKASRSIGAFVVCGGVALFLVWQPSVLTQVAYGCEPGVVVLIVLLSLHGLAGVIQRRRQHSLPGFTRAVPGSAPGSSIRRKLEPSTVDAPAIRDNSSSLRTQAQDS